MMRISQDHRLLLPAWALGLIWARAIIRLMAARDGPDRPPVASRAIDYATDVRPIFERCYECHGPKKQKAGLRLDEKAAALRGRQRRRGHRARQGAESPLVRRVASLRPRGADAPEGRAADRRAGRHAPGLDRPGGELAGRSTAGVGGFELTGRSGRRSGPPCPRSRTAALGAQPDRPLRPRPARGRGALALARGRQGHPAPPPQPRPDRPAADARRGRRLPRRHVARTPTRSRSTGCWPRRTTASAGAGTGSTRPATPTPTATRRTSRGRSGSTATGSSTPSTATCPTTSSSSSSSPATCCPSPTQDQIVATGFLRNSMINEEGGVDPEQFRMEAMFDRMDAIGKSVLGLTIQCAQCHNHKYDPLTQEEYYRLFAFLNNDHEAQRVVYTPDEQMKVAELSAADRARSRPACGTPTPDWQERMAAWEEAVANDQPDWTVVRPSRRHRDGGQRYIAAGGRLAPRPGLRPDQVHTRQFTAKTDAARHHRLPAGAADRPEPARAAARAGRSRAPCALTEFEVEAAPADDPARRPKVKFATATADFDQPETAAGAELRRQDAARSRVTGPVEFAIDGKDETAWGIDAGPGRRNQPRKAVFVAETADRPSAGGTIAHLPPRAEPRRLEQRRPQNNNLGRFRLSRRPTRRTPSPTRCPSASARSWPIPARPADAGAGRRGLQLLADDGAGVEGGQRPDRGALEAVARRRDDARRSTARERAARRRTSSSAATGSSPAKPVTPGVPAFLNPLPAERRADPADASPAGWSTASRRRRPASFVNRVWQAYFGTGLVAHAPRTSARRASRRRHPELLDWLACEFMDARLEPQALHRLIVTSATYRQSQPGDARAATRATRTTACWPAGRGSGSRRRSSATSPWRPAACSTRRSAGRASMPPAPAFLFQPPASYAPFPWIEETGAGPLPPGALHLPPPLDAVPGAADVRRAQRRCRPASAGRGRTRRCRR